ncbi:hypothetical protein K8I28_09425 [bacterium]|nr:hypothetical protein [bacterium]
MARGVDVAKELGMVAKLQSIDSKLLELEEEKGDLPKIVVRLTDEMETKQSELENHRTRVSDIGKERRDLDNQIQMTQVKLKKYQEQLYSVTTNREYDAITSEIESAQAQIKDFEESQLKLLDEEEVLSGQINDLEEAINAINRELSERRAELEEKEEETRSEETELNHAREKLAVRIKKPLMAHYERIRIAKEGTGAAHLYASACGSCYAVVPPQRQAEIRRMEDIILCESCGVILLPEQEYMNLS